jgi:hypothetical protein
LLTDIVKVAERENEDVAVEESESVVVVIGEAVSRDDAEAHIDALEEAVVLGDGEGDPETLGDRLPDEHDDTDRDCVGVAHAVVVADTDRDRVNVTLDVGDRLARAVGKVAVAVGDCERDTVGDPDLLGDGEVDVDPVCERDAVGDPDLLGDGEVDVDPVEEIEFDGESDAAAERDDEDDAGPQTRAVLLHTPVPQSVSTLQLCSMRGWWPAASRRARPPPCRARAALTFAAPVGASPDASTEKSVASETVSEAVAVTEYT